MANPGRLEINFGTVPENFGWLYAMEATAMPFETFADRIRSRNTFPAKLDWGALYTFTTPEEPARAFEFWMRPDEFPDVPRIFKVDGQPVLIDGFTSLPLVDGPYLRSTGHSGRLEIRGPGQDPASAPLVLDYTQPLHPFRTDNAASWPQPLLDRARALIDFARHLLTLTPPRQDDAIDTLRGFDPPAAIAAEYMIFLAELLHRHRIWRLIAEGNIALAGAHAAEAVATYRIAVAASGADSLRVGRDLAALASQLADAGLSSEAVSALQAQLDILGGLEPPADQLLAYRILLAEARDNLIAQLIEDHQVEQAGTHVSATIAAFREYTTLPGADSLRVGRDLAALASQLADAGLSSEAVSAL
ncbi:hypothetical protein, partial [Streptomyces sp. NPDC059468]|uniref:hypothetical protein n=1 Tax=Streptomyces sp. NPDC059468 TaxID=3346845 RepID=UPI00368D4EE9